MQYNLHKNQKQSGKNHKDISKIPQQHQHAAGKARDGKIAPEAPVVAVAPESVSTASLPAI